MPVENKHHSDTSTFMKNSDSVIQNGIITNHHHQSESRSDRTDTSYGSSTSRKEKPNSIFSFLQRFRVKHRNIFEDVASLPSTPHSLRRHQHPRNRWESAESVLSTATASSFAFIPPSQLRGGPRLLHPSSLSSEQTTTAPETSSFVPPITARDNTVFLRRKYNLLGSDASLCPNERKRSLKHLYRNSVGTVENLRIDDHWRDETVFSSFRRSSKPVTIIQRPKSEYSISDKFNKSQRIYCHKPGKGRAPPPPVNGTNSTKTLTNKSTIRKKRKAPSPPENTNTHATTMESVKTDVMSDLHTIETDVDKKEVEKKEEEEAIGTIVCNDSLKLEKGQLKANNRSLTISSTNSSVSSDPSIPVSPKPWYKRSSVQNNKKSSTKKKTPEQLLDEWILEAGLPRSSSFCNDRKTVVVSSPAAESQSGRSKRKSQISMLANISELDREAAEIVQKERKKEHEMAASVDDRFYDPVCNRGVSWNKYISPPDTNSPPKKHSSKDLISIINAIANITKINVNANFFKDSSTSRPVGKQNHEPELTDGPRAASRELKITTEVRDSNKEMQPSQNSVARKKEIVVKDDSKSIVKPSMGSVNDVINDAPKPVKPFSSWICPQCTLENPSWKFICEACNKWRPYSVNKMNGRPTPLVTPKEDSKLPLTEKIGQTSTMEEHNQIKHISNSIRKQVYDILTSGETTNKLNTLEEMATNKSEKIDNDLEETRKARLAFFSKNCLNDLNRDREKVITTSTENCTRNKYYNEEDRRKLREILKELKESLPPERNKFVRQSSDVSSSGAGIVKSESDKFNKLKENLKLSKSFDKSGSDLNSKGAISLEEPLYSVPVKRSLRNSSTKADRQQEEKTSGVEATKSQINENIAAKKISSTAGGLKYSDLERSNRKPLPNSKGNVGGLREHKSSVNLMVNRLLNKLQTAIASGQHHEAANIARELARLRVNCNMTRQGTPDLILNSPPKCGNVGINLHIRRDAIQLVPIFLKLNSNLTINELKKKVLDEYDISSGKQVWMARGKLIDDELASLEQLGANETEVLELYLYSSSDRGSSSSANEVITSSGDTDNEAIRKSPTDMNANNDPRYPSYVLMKSKSMVQSKYSPAAVPSTKKSYPLAGHTASKISDNPYNELKSSSNDGVENNKKTENDEIKDKLNFPHHTKVGRTVVNSENNSPNNKLKHAQIISKVEENIKLNNKLGPKTKAELDKPIIENGRIEIPNGGKYVNNSSRGPEECVQTASDKEVQEGKLKNVSTSIHNEIDTPVNKPETCDNEKKNEMTLREIKPKSEFHIANSVPNPEASLSHNSPSDLILSGEWKCVRCTLINCKMEENCAVCALPKTRSINEEHHSLAVEADSKIVEIDRLANYKELVHMEKSDLISNVEKFECSVCLIEYEQGEGVILKDCLHTFCKGCLAQTVQHSSEAEVKCPFRDENYSCESVLQEREIKALVTPEVYEKHLARSMKEAENKIQNTFHCKTPNCHGWCIFEDNVNEFLCPVCDKTNCLTCQVVHTGLNCKQYQEIINQESETNADANTTRLMLLEMLEKKEAMTCPMCQVILMKKWGCDWLRCSMCKTEICWVTRGFRWGPKGKGDTSGGCRCGVRGIKCHPRCSYCH